MTTTRCLAILYLLCTLLATGCSPAVDESHCWDSSDAPGATSGSSIQIDGQALHQDGSPLSGQVLLTEPPTLEDMFAAVLTLGLSCLKDDLTGLDCNDYQQLALDSAGRFTHTMPEENTRGTLGFDRTFLLFVGLPAGADNLARSSVVAWARFRRQHVQLPPLALWEPALTLDVSGAVLRARFEPPPARACTTQQELQLEFTRADGELVWSQTSSEVDPRVLEDTSGTLQLRARFHNDASQRQVDQFELYSSAVAYTGTAGAPPSRGAACIYTGQPVGACPLSDGQLAVTSVADGRVQLDMGQARALGLVALRGSFSSVTLSASMDGQSWTPLASALGGCCAAVTPPGSLQARYLQLQEAKDDQGQQRTLYVSELSVW